MPSCPHMRHGKETKCWHHAMDGPLAGSACGLVYVCRMGHHGMHGTAWHATSQAPHPLHARTHGHATGWMRPCTHTRTGQPGRAGARAHLVEVELSDPAPPRQLHLEARGRGGLVQRVAQARVGPDEVLLVGAAHLQASAGNQGGGTRHHELIVRKEGPDQGLHAWAIHCCRTDNNELPCPPVGCREGRTAAWLWAHLSAVYIGWVWMGRPIAERTC